MTDHFLTVGCGDVYSLSGAPTALAIINKSQSTGIVELSRRNARELSNYTGNSKMFRLHCFVAIAAAFFLCVTSASAQDADSPPSERTIGGSMKMMLQNKLELSGSPVNLEAIGMSSLFGEAKIPLHTIAGIRFAQGADEQTTVVLLNGDALTGDVNLSDIQFVSDWGEAKVSVAHLVSIVFRDDLAWSGVATPNGKRWRLTKLQRGQPSNSYTDAHGRRIVAPGNRR
jgi:hypothetical protein